MITLKIVLVPIVLFTLAIGQMLVAAHFHRQNGHEKSNLWHSAYHFSFIAIQATVFYVGFIAVALVSHRTPSVTTDTVNNALIILATVLALLFALITNPFSDYVRRLLSRVILHRLPERDEKQVIKHYSQRLSSALDMQRLAETILSLMIETLGIEQGVVFICERDKQGHILLRPLASIGLPNLTRHQFASDSPFIYFFRKQEKFMSGEKFRESAEFKQLPSSAQKWLNELPVEFFVPVLRQRELIGLLAFGSTGSRYYEEDLGLMVTLADQAALALDSARLFEQLALINQEVGNLTNQLAGLDKGKSDFLSIASHELRTPLTHIHGYSKMMLDLTEDELRDPEYVKTIINGIAKGSERLKDVVDIIFDVTEADIGQMNLFVGPVRMSQVIQQATQPLLPYFDERRIALSISGIDEVPILEADGTRLVQAFENLIGNALKYTPDGGLVSVEGDIINLSPSQPAMQIVVNDTGIGIDATYHEKIFEKFFRVDSVYNHSTGKTKFKGAGPGLGLTLVKGIVEAHKGQVWVQSPGYDELNNPGSKFFVVIPLKRSSENELEMPKQSQIETRHWRPREKVEDLS